MMRRALQSQTWQVSSGRRADAMGSIAQSHCSAVISYHHVVECPLYLYYILASPDKTFIREAASYLYLLSITLTYILSPD